MEPEGPPMEIPFLYKGSAFQRFHNLPSTSTTSRTKVQTQELMGGISHSNHNGLISNALQMCGPGSVSLFLRTLGTFFFSKGLSLAGFSESLYYSTDDDSCSIMRGLGFRSN